MPRDTETYPQITRKRYQASEASDIVLKAAAGEIEITQTQLRACEFIINKVLPNPPQETITYETDKPPDFYVVYDQAD